MLEYSAVADIICLHGAECRSNVGVPAAGRDDFRLAIDYWAVEKLIRSTVEAVLKAHPGEDAVAVLARKTPAVMSNTREVTVEIRRTDAARRGER